MTKLAPPSQRGSSLPGAALPTTASSLGVHLPGKMRKGGEEETAPVRKTLGQKHPVLQVPPREGHSVDPYRLTKKHGLKGPLAPTGLPLGWHLRLPLGYTRDFVSLETVGNVWRQARDAAEHFTVPRLALHSKGSSIPLSHWCRDRETCLQICWVSEVLTASGSTTRFLWPEQGPGVPPPYLLPSAPPVSVSDSWGQGPTGLIRTKV